MKKHVGVLAIILITSALLSGCGAVTAADPYDDGYSQLRSRYYCSELMEGTFRQAWKLNIEDGSILTACADPLCAHGAENKECPFRNTAPLEIADGGRYFFYIGYGPGERAIYCFDTEDNVTTKIYKYDKYPSVNAELIYGNGRLYFNIPQIKSSSEGEYIQSTVQTVLYYDVRTKKIERFGEKDEEDALLFACNGRVYYRCVKDGTLCVSSGSFDGSEPVPLPDGAWYSWWDGYWPCGPGYVVNSTAAPDIYLYDEKRSVPLPPEASGCILVGTSANEDTFYFTLGSASPTEDEGGRYVVKICLLNKDGSYRIYSVQSNFSFFVKKGYGNRVVCKVLSEFIDGADILPGPEEEQSPNNLILIDLESGKTSLYNTYSDSVLDMYLGDVTLKVERLK